MTKTGLVLEGGGMRGAYTAGCLTWLVRNHIQLDYGVGISSGAIYLCSYLMKNEKQLHDISVLYMSDKKNVGLRPLLREGRYVGYTYMFDELLRKEVRYDTTPIKQARLDMEFGIYDMNQSDTLWFNSQDLDDDLIMLKAACSLPIAGHIVDYQNHRFLDGGIKIMVPIQRSLDHGCDKNLVITTKPAGYVRKPAGAFMRWLMKFNYRKYPKMVHDYINRHLRYNEQMALVEKEVEEGKAFLVRPSVTVPVKRFSGDPENLKKLYELGIQDMEDHKEEILHFLGKDTLEESTFVLPTKQKEEVLVG